MRVLYAGDSPFGGAANYLLGVLGFLGARTLHIPPSKILAPAFFKKSYDAIILSDFSHRKLPRVSEKALLEQVEEGAGLLMVGGWASFAGPWGEWRGSWVEEILPVSCSDRDDRIHCPGGALMIPKRKHSLLGSLDFSAPPMICGFNHVRPRKGSLVVLAARKVRMKKGPAFEKKEYPLLVIDPHPHRRIAAFTTDLAPHWCGGLLDWGSKRIKLRLKNKMGVEVGELYLRFVSSLLRWMTSAG